MSELVARTGRHQQRYEAGCRLIAGFRYSEGSNGNKSEKILEVLMINSTSGPGLLFPKGGWENDETVEEAAVREAWEEAGVRGDLMDLDIVGDLLFIHLLLDLISFVIFLFKSKNLVKLFTVGSVHDIAHVLPIIWPVLFGLALELTAHGLSLVSLSFADILLLLHFLGHYQFKSKTLQDECSPEGRCRASMFALFVKEELDSWPEQSRRVRSWVTIPEAFECCRHSWMREALENGFNKWSDDGMIRTMKATNQVSSDASDRNTSN
ncbi:NUDIX hydrolase 16, mitochondrial [Tanacetum coccineum]